ncbi:MAG: hypothetical protein IT186_00890 [Acidobacteria bacterium]|nr:hypothetical protein [Acidobacteriota bacterium]
MDFLNLTGDADSTIVNGSQRFLTYQEEAFFRLAVSAMDSSSKAEYLPCEKKGTMPWGSGEPCIDEETPAALVQDVPLSRVSDTRFRMPLAAGERAYFYIKAHPAGAPTSDAYLQIYPGTVGPWPGNSYQADAVTGVLDFTVPPAAVPHVTFKKMSPGMQPTRINPGLGFGAGIADLSRAINLILANNNTPSVPPPYESRFKTIREWAQERQGNPIFNVNCMKRYYNTTICGRPLWDLVKVDPSFGVQGQWLAAASYGLLQIRPDSLRVRLGQDGLIAIAPFIRAQFYDPMVDDPTSKLFDPSRCVMLGALMDSRAAVQAELGAPIVLTGNVMEDVCPGDPAPPPSECTWRRLWKRRFRVFNAGSQRRADAVDYANGIVDVRSPSYIPY